MGRKGKASQPAPWRNRITGHAEVDPRELQANPNNWKRHTKHQRAAIEGVLSDIGWLDEVIVNTTTGNMLDGHMRVEQALERGEPTVPVKYVELTEDEERLALATFDPIGAAAEAEKEQLDALLHQVHTSDAALTELLDGVAKDAGLYADGAGKKTSGGQDLPKVHLVVVECVSGDAAADLHQRLAGEGLNCWTEYAKQKKRRVAP